MFEDLVPPQENPFLKGNLPFLIDLPLHVRNDSDKMWTCCRPIPQQEPQAPRCSPCYLLIDGVTGVTDWRIPAAELLKKTGL